MRGMVEGNGEGREVEDKRARQYKIMSGQALARQREKKVDGEADRWGRPAGVHWWE